MYGAGGKFWKHAIKHGSKKIKFFDLVSDFSNEKWNIQKIKRGKKDDSRRQIPVNTILLRAANLSLHVSALCLISLKLLNVIC